jgi:hypothetical protein
MGLKVQDVQNKSKVFAEIAQVELTVVSRRAANRTIARVAERGDLDLAHPVHGRKSGNTGSR